MHAGLPNDCWCYEKPKTMIVIDQRYNHHTNYPGRALIRFCHVSLCSRMLWLKRLDNVRPGSKKVWSIYQVHVLKSGTVPVLTGVSASQGTYPRAIVLRVLPVHPCILQVILGCLDKSVGQIVATSTDAAGVSSSKVGVFVQWITQAVIYRFKIRTPTPFFGLKRYVYAYSDSSILGMARSVPTQMVHRFPGISAF